MHQFFSQLLFSIPIFFGRGNHDFTTGVYYRVYSGAFSLLTESIFKLLVSPHLVLGFPYSVLGSPHPHVALSPNLWGFDVSRKSDYLFLLSGSDSHHLVLFSFSLYFGLISIIYSLD